MTALENYIRSFITLKSGELEVIQAHLVPAAISKGEYFSKRGRVCDKLIFIVSGYLRVFVETEDREVTQWISCPGGFVTDLSSFIFQTPGRWNMQALTDCELLEISREEYDQLCKSLPAWKDLDRLFIVKCFAFMEERIFSHLHMSSEERFNQLMKTQPELFNLVPLQYLASMLGMTPETLSRLRKRMTP